MVFIHEKESNSILPKGGLKYLVGVTTSIVLRTFNVRHIPHEDMLKTGGVPVFVVFPRL